MTPSTDQLAPDVDAILARLIAGAKQACGLDLLGAALCGGLVKGRFTPGISDINLLLVVRETSRPTLERLAPILTAARREDRVSALVCTPAELRSLARLFPVKVRDMQISHRSLFGDVGLAGLAVSRSAIALRSAQELRNAELRLRQRILDRGAAPEAIWRGFLAGLPSTAVTLEVLMAAEGKPAGRSRAEIFSAAAREMGFPPERTALFAARHRTDPRPSDDEVRACVEAYLGFLAHVTDRLESWLAD